MRTIAIIQARFSSTRLPGKIMLELGGKPVIINIVERVVKAETVDEVVVATSDDTSDDKVELMLKKYGIQCFRGNLNNVLERYYLCAKDYNADIVIRLTGDNALVAPELIDEAVDVFGRSYIDYLLYKSTLPIGMCVEVFTFEALKKAYFGATDRECLEHVTPYIRCNPEMFKVLIYDDKDGKDCSELRLTIDTREDFELISKIYNCFDNNMFSYGELLSLLAKNPNFKLINNRIVQKVVAYKGEDV